MIDYMAGGGEDEIRKTLRYEYSNRAFALGIASRMSAVAKEPDEQAYWAAFLAFEQYNRARYASAAIHFGISPEGRWFDSERAWFVTSALRVAPQSTMDRLVSNTRDYIPRLQRLVELDSSSHTEFFSYVVEQERVLLKSLEDVVKQDWETATRRLEEFVAAQAAPDQEQRLR